MQDIRLPVATLDSSLGRSRANANLFNKRVTQIKRKYATNNNNKKKKDNLNVKKS